MKKGELYGFEYDSKGGLFKLKDHLVFPVVVVVKQVDEMNYRGVPYAIGVKSNFMSESPEHFSLVGKLIGSDVIRTLHSDEYDHAEKLFMLERNAKSKSRIIQVSSTKFSYLDVLKQSYGIGELVRGNVGGPNGVSFLYKDQPVRQTEDSEDKKNKELAKLRLKEERKKSDEIQYRPKRILKLLNSRSAAIINKGLDSLVEDGVLTTERVGNYYLTLDDLNMPVFPRYKGERVYFKSKELAERIVKASRKPCRVELME